MADLETPKALGKLFVIVSDAFHNSFVEKFLKNVFASYAAKDNIPDGCKIEVPVADDAYGQPTPVWFIADTNLL